MLYSPLKVEPHLQPLLGKTRVEASTKLAKALSDREGGLVFDAKNLTIDEYLDRWLTECVKGTVKETTYANYSYITRVHISPALGRVKLKSLTPAHVRRFYGEKAHTNLSAATVKKMHVVLRRALSQAVSDELIARNVAESVKPPRASAPGDEIGPLSSAESPPRFWKQHAERGLKPSTCWPFIVASGKGSYWPCTGKT